MTSLGTQFDSFSVEMQKVAAGFWDGNSADLSYENKNSVECKQANKEELVDLIVPYIPLVRRYLQVRVPEDDVDDVLQDVMLRVIRRDDRTEIERPKCYLFQVAQATLIDRHRRQSARKAFLHCELMEEMHPVDELHPLHILIARDEFRTLAQVLSGLPERTREIIIAVRIGGESLKALASKYEVSTSAIEKHVTKALKALEKTRNRPAHNRMAASIGLGFAN